MSYFFPVKPSRKLHHSEVLCSVFISKISLCFIIIAEMFVSLVCCSVTVCCMALSDKLFLVINI